MWNPVALRQRLKSQNPAAEPPQGLLRFCVTGLLYALLNFAGAMLLTELIGLHYLTSLAVSSVSVATAGFIINRWWTSTCGAQPLLAPLSYLLHRAWSFGLIWLEKELPT
jgi:putative flippase GtrA